MQNEAILILLFVVATAVAIAVQRLAVPYTVALVFTGLMLGLLHAFEAPHLTKSLLFNVFLPGLLFEAAFHIEFRQFWRNRLTIHSLALPGVVAAIGLTTLIPDPGGQCPAFRAEFRLEARPDFRRDYFRHRPYRRHFHLQKHGGPETALCPARRRKPAQ